MDIEYEYTLPLRLQSLVVSAKLLIQNNYYSVTSTFNGCKPSYTEIFPSYFTNKAKIIQSLKSKEFQRSL